VWREFINRNKFCCDFFGVVAGGLELKHLLPNQFCGKRVRRNSVQSYVPHEKVPCVLRKSRYVPLVLSLLLAVGVGRALAYRHLCQPANHHGTANCHQLPLLSTSFYISSHTLPFTFFTLLETLEEEQQSQYQDASFTFIPHRSPHEHGRRMQ